MNEQPKFTPGPWKAWGHNVYRAGAGDGANICAMSELRATTEVRHTEPSFNSPHLETIYANARLIAAAPEMYEALRSMVAGFKPFTFRPVGAPGSPAREEQDEQNRAHAAARAALAKVEGRG